MLKHGYRKRGQAGMTLIEIMISTGLVGLIMTALMFLLAQSGKFGTVMENNFKSIEGAEEAVAMFSSVLPEITRVQSCYCRNNTSTLAACVWNPTDPWHDPVSTGGAAAGSAILTGEFEAYNGLGATNTSMASLLTSAISISGETCASEQSTLTGGQLRGCKLPVRLKYWAPVEVSGTTPSKAGKLTLEMGSSRSVSLGDNTNDGAKNLGISKFACGFDTTAGGRSAGSVFVLNLMLKARANLANAVNSTYESWYPGACTSHNYCKGTFREVQLKYTLRNLVHRGAYFWKPESIKGCLAVGKASAVAAKCCSGATNGTNCITCKAAGTTVGTSAACCSQNLSGSVCL